MHKRALISRVIGFVASLVLTMTAYFIIVNPDYFHFTQDMAVKGILLLAFLQASVQVMFFLDLWHEKGPPWNLGSFLSTLSIIFIIIFFSIWIMDNLNYNMMPK